MAPLDNRDLPAEFGSEPANATGSRKRANASVYRQFRRWTLAGLWELILDALNNSGAAPDAVQMVDSTVVRAHQQSNAQKLVMP